VVAAEPPGSLNAPLLEREASRLISGLNGGREMAETAPEERATGPITSVHATLRKIVHIDMDAFYASVAGLDLHDETPCIRRQ
jgi:hypothetical protein